MNKCKRGSDCTYAHRALTEDEKSQRSKWEQETRAKGLDPYAPRGSRSATPASSDKEKKKKEKKRKSSKSPGASSDKKKIPCKFHKTAGGCKLGDACQFKHA